MVYNNIMAKRITAKTMRTTTVASLVIREGKAKQ